MLIGWPRSILQGGIDRKESRGSPLPAAITPERNDSSSSSRPRSPRYDAGVGSSRRHRRGRTSIVGLVEPRARTYGKVEATAGSTKEPEKAAASA